MFLGLIIKHHLVQIVPVPIRARFCVRESFSAGRKKSDTPARTRAHFITGALHGQASVRAEIDDTMAIGNVYVIREKWINVEDGAPEMYSFNSNFRRP